MKTTALIVAAGRGVRFGGKTPKQFRSMGARPLLGWTVRQFEKSRLIDDIVLVVPEDFLLYTSEKIIDSGITSKLTKIVTGGETRRQSVLRGLQSLPISTGYVAIHDGARPIVDFDDIDRVVEMAQKERAAILARPITETVKRGAMEYVLSTLDRTRLFLAETPQVFQYDLILAAHKNASPTDMATDDAMLVETLGFKVKMVITQKPNIKVTTENDLKIARMFLEDEEEDEEKKNET